LYERVIISLDLAKPRSTDDDGSDLETSFGMLLAAGNWDIVIFDEGHRLSRNDRGQSTLRFKLAQALRSKTDSMLLLTGTPHQGDTGKFRNLLTLVRPDLKSAIDQLEVNSDVVREIVLRNRKIDTVDIEGNFLFKGLMVKRIEVVHDPDFADMESDLKTYLRTGYQAGENIGGSEGRAVGFVMTIYRKLASSSVAALYISLKARLAKLENGQEPEERVLAPDDDDTADDVHSLPGAASARQFFEGEAEMVRRLLEKTSRCMRSDRKGDQLLEVVKSLVDQGEKVLIFTEYRATQAFILHKLRSILNGREPVLIHGGQTADEKREAVQQFDDEAPVLISTEAGGEGLNMHRNCHVLINYDLPWNPSRISQRIGRLYRYGQMKKVVVFNFQARDTIDNEIIGILIDRVSVIVSEMVRVSSEFADNDAYAAEIMGELLDRVDISQLLEDARSGHVDRTEDRIDAALKEARKAKEMQDEVLQSIDDLDLKTTIENSFTTEEVAGVLKRALPFFDIELSSESRAQNFVIRLPAEMKGRFPEFGGRTVIPVTTQRRGWRPHSETVLLDFSSSFVKFLVGAITSPEFEGGYGAFDEPDLPELFVAFLARYQNDQGKAQSERLILIERDGAGSFSTPPELIRQLLRAPAARGKPVVKAAGERHAELAAARDRAEILMAEGLNKFQHPNDLVLLAVGERGIPAGSHQQEETQLEEVAPA